MSYLLADPTAVLVAGGPDEAVERVRAALPAAAPGDVPAAAAVDDAVAVLDERDDVGCVVVLDPADAAPSDACRAIRDAEPAVPVVVFRPATGCDPAALARLSDCRFLPADAGEDALAEAVAAARETYADRRDRRAESDLWRTLLAEAEVPIFAKDEGARHLYKAEIEHDVDPEDARGKTDVELFDGEAAEDSLADDREVIDTGRPVRERVEGHVEEDHEFWTETTKVPWRDDDGEVQGLVGLAYPVTERKRLERRLSAQSERIDQFVSYVSHDLRTPLQIAFGALERARRGDEAALEKAREAVERIDGIVEDLSRVSTNDGTDVSADALDALRGASLTTDLVPLAEDVWTVIAPGEAELVVDLPEDAVVGAEVGTVRPVLENLFKNAIDHAGPDVTVWLDATEDGGLAVEDDGDGIPADAREKVLNAGYTTAADGTGTGLSIVQETVEAQGWTLSIAEGDRTGGARFEIEGLPLIARPPCDRDEAEPVELEDRGDVGPVSIPGSASDDPDADRWTVVGGGDNVWGDTHEFRWVGAAADAPVRVEARVAAFDGADEYSKAGVAVRADEGQFAPLGYVGQSRDHGTEVTWRFDRDGHTESDQFEEPAGAYPWYRVEYVDGVVTCSLSADGAEWHPVDQRALDLGDEVEVGLLVCAHSEHATAEAVFADVRATRLE